MLRPPRPASAGRGGAGVQLVLPDSHCWLHQPRKPGGFTSGLNFFLTTPILEGLLEALSRPFPKSWWAVGFWDLGVGVGSLGTYKKCARTARVDCGSRGRGIPCPDSPTGCHPKRNLGDVLDSVPHFVVQIARRLGCEGSRESSLQLPTLSFMASAPGSAKRHFQG